MKAALGGMNTWRTYALDEIVDLGPLWSIYRGRDVQSGKTALVHLVAPSVPSDRAASVARELRSEFLTSPDLQDVLLEFGQYHGVHGLVTEYIPAALKAAKESIPSAPEPEKIEPGKIEPGKTEPVTSVEPDEFVRLFGLANGSTTEPEPLFSEMPSATEASEPDEFTRLFLMPRSGHPNAGPESTPASPDAKANTEPTEFGRLFQTHRLESHAYENEIFDSEPARAAAVPDEFSRFHQSPTFDPVGPLSLPVRAVKRETKDPLQEWLQSSPASASLSPPQISSEANFVFDPPSQPVLVSHGSSAPTEFSGFIERSSARLGAAGISEVSASDSDTLLPETKSSRLWAVLAAIGVIALLLVIAAVVLARVSAGGRTSPIQRSESIGVTALPVKR